MRGATSAGTPGTERPHGPSIDPYTPRPRHVIARHATTVTSQPPPPFDRDEFPPRDVAAIPGHRDDPDTPHPRPPWACSSPTMSVLSTYVGSTCVEGTSAQGVGIISRCRARRTRSFSLIIGIAGVVPIRVSIISSRSHTFTSRRPQCKHVGCGGSGRLKYYPST